jgi:hypothetical protein
MFAGIYKTFIMEAATQLELMEKIQRELEDIKNSQTSLVKKIAQIEIHNLDLDDKELEDALNAIHQHIADSVDKANSISSDFDIKINLFKQTNNL